MFTADVNTGASGDIRQASALARHMVRDWGMSDRLGFVFYGDDDSKLPYFDMGAGRVYSEETAKIIDEEVKKLIDVLYDETRKLLEANRDHIEALAKALLKYETLDAADVERLMKGETLTRPTVADLLEQEHNRRESVTPPPLDAKSPDLRLGGGPLPAPG
jgi:cell division protease FtsH